MEDERIVTNNEIRGDEFEQSIRPELLKDYIGQKDVKEKL